MICPKTSAIYHAMYRKQENHKKIRGEYRRDRDKSSHSNAFVTMKKEIRE